MKKIITIAFFIFLTALFCSSTAAGTINYIGPQEEGQKVLEQLLIADPCDDLLAFQNDINRAAWFKQMTLNTTEAESSAIAQAWVCFNRAGSDAYANLGSNQSQILFQRLVSDLMTGGDDFVDFLRFYRLDGTVLDIDVFVIRFRAWKVLKKADSPLRTNVPLLEKISRDLSLDPSLAIFFDDIDVVRAIEIIAERNLLEIPKYADLSISEASAITRLTMNYGFELSEALVSGALTQFQQKMVSLLDNAFTKLPRYSENPILHRLEFRDASVVSGWSIGTRLDYPNFISTAKRTESSYIDGGSFNNLYIKINNQDVPAIDIEDFSIYNGAGNNELEALILRGKKLEVRSIGPQEHPDLPDWLINDQMNPSGESTILTIVVDVVD